VRTLKPGDVIVVPSGLPDIEKNAKGQYKAVDVMVLRSNGRTERFTVRRRDYDGMVDLLGKIAGKGAIFSPSPSLDLRRLVRVADRPDVDDEADDDR
jgi:hypothetical protein